MAAVNGYKKFLLTWYLENSATCTYKWFENENDLKNYANEHYENIEIINAIEINYIRDIDFRGE